MVRAMVAYGIPQDDIALVIGIHDTTLRRYYRKEINTAAPEANAKMAQNLYNLAMAGNVTANIFWLKARAGWKETLVNEGKTTNLNFNVDTSSLTAEEAAIIYMKALES